MIHKKIVYLTIALGLSLVSTAQQTPAPKQQKSVLIINAKAHIGNGTVLDNSAIGFKNGKIDLVSNDKNIAVSNYETVIDAKGKEVYPGFIAPNSTLGLVEIDAVKSSDDESEIGTYNPHVRSLIAYTADSKVIETVRPNGILMAQITPRGGRIPGTSSIVQLDAWNWEDASIKTDDGIHLNWPRSYSRAGWWAEPGGIEMNKNYDPQVKAIQEYFDNAFAYLGSKNVKKDIPYEAMKGLQTGEKSLYVNANGEKEIIDAQQIANGVLLARDHSTGELQTFKIIRITGVAPL